MIEIEGLQVSFAGQPVLRGLDLRVEVGEWLLFLGPNGAGKTTTIRALLGQLRPQSGRLRVAGHDVRHDPMAVRRAVGYLPERYLPYRFLSGREVLAFVADAHGVPVPERNRRSVELLELLGLSEAADQPTVGYSQGMIRKLGLAAAMIHQPPLLILDEPTGNLDASAASLVREVLRGLAAGGTTIMMSTHVLGATESLCSSVGILHGGRLAMRASREALAERFPDQSLEQVFLTVTGGELERAQVEGFLERWRGA